MTNSFSPTSTRQNHSRLKFVLFAIALLALLIFIVMKVMYFLEPDQRFENTLRSFQAPITVSVNGRPPDTEDVPSNTDGLSTASWERIRIALQDSAAKDLTPNEQANFIFNSKDRDGGSNTIIVYPSNKFIFSYRPRRAALDMHGNALDNFVYGKPFQSNQNLSQIIAECLRVDRPKADKP